MRCKECGAEVEDGRKFCRKCGAIFDRDESFANTAENGSRSTPHVGYTPYQAPPRTAYDDRSYSPTLSTKSILLDFLLLFVSGIFTGGIAPLIILIVWATGHENATKQNFARAALIFMGIMLALVILLVILAVAIAATVFANF